MLPPWVSLAALVVDNRRLEVRAYVGSADFSEDARFAHVDMVQAMRSPGSALKPFLYGLALDAGLLNSEVLLSDVRHSFSGYQSCNFPAIFSEKNLTGAYHNNVAVFLGKQPASYRFQRNQTVR